MEEKLNLFEDKIKAATSIAIVGHKNPDGDSLCSMIALAKLIEENYGIRCRCLYDGNVPNFLTNVPLRDWAKFYEKVDTSAPFDVVILVDYGAAHQLGGPLSIAQNAKFLIEIDHHKNDNPMGALVLSDDTAAATGVIIYQIMRKLGWQYDWAVMDLLAVAIMTDTGNFKFARNGAPLIIMGELVDEGVNIRRLLESMYNKPRRAVQTEARIVSEAEFFYKGRLALATIRNEDYRNLDGRGDMTLSLLEQIKGVEYVVLLKEQKEDKIGISIRSRGNPIDGIAASFGGGGHARAAGAVVCDTTLATVRDRVLEVFKGV